MSKRNLSMGVYCLYVGEKTIYDILVFAARGCRSFIFYNYGPRTLGAADNFSERDTAIHAVARATRLLVRAEDYFQKAKRPPREAVLIYSRTAEILDSDNAVVRNRAYIYLALNHAQVPMDILSERDVLNGRLDSYKVAYLSGAHLRRDVASRIRDWVRRGGHLWADVGAGMRDEADNRLELLEPVFGVKQRFIERKYPVRFGFYLAVTPGYELGRVRWPRGPWGRGGTTSCVLQRAIVKPEETSVIAHFDDGAPAAFSNNFGSGKATLLAYAAGLTYSRFYRQKKRQRPYRFDALDRLVIVQAAIDAGVKRPVKVSMPGIEATRIDSPKGTIVTLIDMWFQNPTAKIEIPFDHQPNMVRSVNSGPLDFSVKNGWLSFKVSINITDTVIVE